MKRIAAVALVLTALTTLMVAAFLGWDAIKLNSFIERCHDDTSSSYIRDDTARARFCDETAS